MYAKVAFLIFTTSLLESFVFGNDSSSVLKNSIADWTKCCWDDYPANCLEKRTIRNVHDYNVVLRKELGLNEIATERSGKLLEEPPDKELESLQTENQQILREIENKTGDLNNPRGLVEEVGDFVVYLAGKFFSSLIGGKGDDILDKQPESDESEAKEQVPQERGHKKKELKKKNRHLKIILLLMLFKNKIKMFLNKLQFLVQLKFLGVATINMIANVIRLWIELKKKHKPNKVVYYENAHHQHHYDNEHIHDQDDGHFSHPTSYSHYAHHEEEEESGGGGLWPWSRSYTEKPSQPVYVYSDPYQGRPGKYSVAYYNKRKFS